MKGLKDFPATGTAPHYVMISRNDTVVGPIQEPTQSWAAPHGPSAIGATGVIRLETGQMDASDASSPDIEDYWKGSTPPQFASHSGIFTPGSTAYKNLLGVVLNNEVELYLPDKILWDLPGKFALVTPGNDRTDIDPVYVKVEP